MEEESKATPATAGTSGSPSSTSEPGRILRRVDRPGKTGRKTVIPVIPSPGESPELKPLFRQLLDAELTLQMAGENRDRTCQKILYALNSHRIRCGIRLEAVIAAMNIDPRSMKLMLTGLAVPRMSTLNRFAGALNLDLPQIPKVFVAGERSTIIIRRKPHKYGHHHHAPEGLPQKQDRPEGTPAP